MEARTDTPPSAAELFRQQASTVKDDLRELGRRGLDAAQEKLGEAKQKAQSVEGQIEDYVRQKPLKSVLIAAGAGLVLGLLLRRR